jgi:hypothetical protein
MLTMHGRSMPADAASMSRYAVPPCQLYPHLSSLLLLLLLLLRLLRLRDLLRFRLLRSCSAAESHKVSTGHCQAAADVLSP